MERKATVWIPGAVAGLVGAGVLALWFLLVDVVAGEPFRTPAMIGGALMGREELEVSGGLVVVFSLIHFLAFVIVGVFAAWAMAQLERAPNFLLGIALGFVLFTTVFYGSAAVAGIDVVAQLGWVEVLVGNLLAGIAIVGLLHQAGVTRPIEWTHALRQGTVLREGLIAGVLSGFMVASWFLIVDAAQGRAFFTPSALGAVLFQGATELGDVQVSFWMTAAYTPVHYAFFIPVGILAAAVVHQAERQPPILIGAMLLFVVFEAFFLGLIAVAAEFLLGSLAWWSIAVGNLVGVVVLAGYLWRKHPELAGVIASDRMEKAA